MMMGGRPAFPSITNHFTQRDKKLFTMIKTETEGGGERERATVIPVYSMIWADSMRNIFLQKYKKIDYSEDRQAFQE